MLSDKEFKKRIGFLVGEKYRLDLKWKSLTYNKGICNFKDAYFSGPALSFAEQIPSNNFILVDLYKQYFIFAKTVYIAKLSWGEVSYAQDNTVAYLKGAKLEHMEEINKVPKLRKSDYMVINTKGHDRETHHLHPTYEATIVNELGDAYNFWNVEGRFRKV